MNFFFMGAGYLYNGRRAVLGVMLTLAALGLTYVEFGIQEPLPTLYAIMFACVFIANTGLAIDGYREAKAINGEG